MLNISKVNLKYRIDPNLYSALKKVEEKSISSYLIKVLIGFGIVLICAMFLPWTQNIRAKGAVTTLFPSSRPQTIQSLLGGRIEEWHVLEGQIVKAGDTIMRLSEVKEEYLDPQILARTQGQVDAKSQSVLAYQEKANNLEDQFEALINSKNVKLQQNKLKINQTQLKLESDVIDLEATKVKASIAKDQLVRMQELFEKGLKSLTDLESKRVSIQEANAKVVYLKNLIDSHRNELKNLEADFKGIENEFQDKISKSKSERMTAMSDKFDAEGSIDKLKSQYNAYEVRTQNYFVKAPIDGMVTTIFNSGLGEIIKGGDAIITIVPTDYQLAVETFVRPQDVTLLKRGQKVRIQFDGWPAIVFSGWPQSSYGTFGGKVYAIENFISDNGLYRILLAPNEEDQPWPIQVRIGSGANTITLLNNVSVGYELWRQLNGFPPDYYSKAEVKDVKTKAPLKKVK